MNSFFNVLGGLPLIITFVKKVFPLIDLELHHWSTHGVTHACPELKEQALSSIKDKKFHCQGGSIYSLYPGVHRNDFTSLIVALQTISDYLDNLCDNAGVIDEKAFRQLHQAMTDALDPNVLPQDYYAFYPYKQDGDYLRKLVITCQQQVKKLPSYELVKPEIQKLACLYSDLQTYKHLDPNVREEKMLTWIDQHLENYPLITHWEFAAATGSTLGMFMLCAAASDKRLTPQIAASISSAYFPWISGLHILLDYFIDASEDQERGDLNFVAYYEDSAQLLSRLSLFTKQAFLQASTLPHPAFHKIVVQG
ncbi:MAG: hypothetical protein K0R78_1918, partial [Pelosinus sp.]|nr:hypothetical protein [Pelosinus sp.]